MFNLIPTLFERLFGFRPTKDIVNNGLNENYFFNKINLLNVR